MYPLDDPIVNTGDLSRLRRCMRAAAAGERVVLGFLGGSITQGSLASHPWRSYARLVWRWWRRRFPQADIRFVNAGIGGTDSRFGAARVREDLLCRKPDVVFLEFSVNDENTDPFCESYEGLVRAVYGHESRPALVLLHNMRYDNGESAEEMHLRVGRHYDLPCISMRAALSGALAAGRIPVRAVSPDGLHPNDAGHALVAAAVAALLETAWAGLSDSEESSGEAPLPPPLTSDIWERAARWQNRSAAPELRGFVPDPLPQRRVTEMFRRGYAAWHAGDRIVFRLEGRVLAVQYRKSVRRPAPVALAVVDGREDEAVVLDANFQENWGDCLYLQPLPVCGEGGLHRVEIRIVESHPFDSVPFYLVSVITAG